MLQRKGYTLEFESLAGSQVWVCISSLWRGDDLWKTKFHISLAAFTVSRNPKGDFLQVFSYTSSYIFHRPNLFVVAIYVTTLLR